MKVNTFQVHKVYRVNVDLPRRPTLALTNQIHNTKRSRNTGSPCKNIESWCTADTDFKVKRFEHWQEKQSLTFRALALRGQCSKRLTLLSVSAVHQLFIFRFVKHKTFLQISVTANMHVWQLTCMHGREEKLFSGYMIIPQSLMLRERDSYDKISN